VIDRGCQTVAMLSSLFLFAGLAAAAAPDPMFQRAAKLLEDRYLHFDEMDPAKAFLAAAEEAESAIPWLIVTGDETAVVLADASSGESNTIQFSASADTPDLAQLVAALETIETVILGFETDVPEDVDLPVELLQGVMRTLDKHTVVMAHNRLARFDERIKGKLTGIGAKLRMEDGILWAEVVFADTPADRGGLHVEDAIHRVDGVSTLGMSLSQAVDRIRGPKGSKVVLSVKRRQVDGSDAALDLVFTRDEVNIPNVNWTLSDDGVGIIRIENFSEHTSRLTLEALSSFANAADSGHPYRGILLDLRGNSGGSLIQSAETADLFLGDGEIVRTEGRNGGTVPNLVRSIGAHPAATPDEEPLLPLVVMQNHKSASASEIVAGALASLGRAVIIGRTSYGKGTVQKLYTLRGGKDRARLKLTVAEYKLHDGRAVHGEGIAADLVMRRVVFSSAGAWLPSQAEAAVPLLLAVDERVGWRSEGKIDKTADPLEDFGRALVLGMVGPTRTDGLEAIERLVDTAGAAAAEAVASTFSLRQIDWRPTDEQPGILDAAVTLELLGPAKAGEKVVVRAEVQNDGPAPLYQVRVRLLTDRRTPWHAATIPVGFVPPGESAIGQVEISVRTNTVSRSDDVKMRLEADGLEPVDLDPVQFDVKGINPPPLAVNARLVPHGDHHRVEVELENQGDINLTGVRLSLGWRDDSGVELIDREAIAPVLGVDERYRFDLELRVLEDAPETAIPLELRVGADRFPSLVQMPIMVPRDGSQAHRAAPIVFAEAPTRVAGGALTVPIKVEDDQAVSSVAVWWNGDKLTWLPGDGPTVKASVDLALEKGSNTLTVIAIDDGGLQTKLSRKIWGDQAEVAP
jgi:carboxyl-terminal processing protease